MTLPTIFIVSGGQGTSGERILQTALAQFQVQPPVVLVPQVRQMAEVEAVISRAQDARGIIVHTLVDSELRIALTDLARARDVPAVDLMGPLLLRLSGLLEQQPLGQPGLYRQLHEDYFRRMDAIEFTVEHDDGRNPHELPFAEIVLVGVSRVGKTPLSMYLGTRGWKVANVPLVKNVPPPDELSQINPARVVGLLAEPDQLVLYRHRRQEKMSYHRQTDYARPDDIREEMDYARRIFQRGHFAVLDVSDKPIEESADEVISLVSHRLQAQGES